MPYPALRHIALANSAINVGNTAIAAISVLLFIGPVGLPRAAFGAYLTVLVAGAILGTAISERIVEWTGHRRVLRAGPVIIGLGYAAICVTVDPWVSGIAAFCLVLTGMLWNVATRVVRQRLTPDPVLGRMTATMQLISLAATPIGGLLGGVIAEAAGVRSVGYLAVTAAVIAWWQMRRIDAGLLVFRNPLSPRMDVET